MGATMDIEFAERRSAICGGVVCVGDGWLESAVVARKCLVTKLAFWSKRTPNCEYSK